MKLKGFLIEGVTYLISEAEIEKAGGLEEAAKLAKEKREKVAEIPELKKKAEKTKPETEE